MQMYEIEAQGKVVGSTPKQMNNQMKIRSRLGGPWIKKSNPTALTEEKARALFLYKYLTERPVNPLSSIIITSYLRFPSNIHNHNLRIVSLKPYSKLTELTHTHTHSIQSFFLPNFFIFFDFPHLSSSSPNTNRPISYTISTLPSNLSSTYPTAIALHSVSFHNVESTARIFHACWKTGESYCP